VNILPKTRAKNGLSLQWKSWKSSSATVFTDFSLKELQNASNCTLIAAATSNSHRRNLEVQYSHVEHWTEEIDAKEYLRPTSASHQPTSVSHQPTSVSHQSASVSHQSTSVSNSLNLEHIGRSGCDVSPWEQVLHTFGGVL